MRSESARYNEVHDAKARHLLRTSQLCDRNDCTVFSTAIATGADYGKVSALWRDIAGRRRNKGVQFTAWAAMIYGALGFRLECVPRGAIKTVITAERKLDWRKTYLLCTRGHVLAMHKGQVLDWTEGRSHRVTDIWEVLPK